MALPPAAVIAIVVAAGEGGSAEVEALLAAAEEALGAGVTLRVFEAASPSDDGALDLEADLAARAVATVVWQDAARTRARTRVHVARTNRWTDREIAFVPVDRPIERGRALGFAVASMMPDADGRPRPSMVEVRRGGPPRDAASPGRGALGLCAVGAGGVGGGVGAGLDGAFFVAAPLAVRVGAALRAGEVPGLDGGADLVGSAALGLAFWPLLPAPGRRVGLGLRADALLLRHEVTRRDGETGATERRGRFVPGADLLAQVAVRLSGGLELVLGAGVEAAFGRIDVAVEDGTAPAVSMATIGRVRAVGEGGLRWRF